MRRLAIVIGIAFLGGGLSACVSQDGDLSAIPQHGESLLGSAYPAVVQEPGQGVRPPSGFVAFCDRNPGECRAHRDQPSKLTFTAQNWATLQEVNVAVNSSVRPVDDSEHYGIAEFWTVPVDGEGDCEDYVLAKRKMLMLLGLPEPALRIAVVLNQRKVRHAVLTVVTDRGDYVLDNMQDDILPPDKTGYTWIERQDPASRTGWLAMN